MKEAFRYLAPELVGIAVRFMGRVRSAIIGFNDVHPSKGRYFCLSEVIHMKARRIFVASMLCCLSWSAPAQAGKHCSIPGISFASCPGTPRHFESIVIAIPGWNGTCKTAFGERAGHLLNAMRRQNFFDIDCFDYDSHDTVLQKSRDQLRDRINALRGAGYSEFTFVTHSTGGVLALDFLLSEALGDKKPLKLRVDHDASIVFKSDDGLRVRGLYTWAVPINGLRFLVRTGGSVVNFAGFSKKVLPDLDPDSTYLKLLKERLRAFDDAVSSVQSGAASYGFEWYVLQGQDEDEVVKSVQMTDDWYPKNASVTIVNTGVGHSYNVGVSADASGKHGRLTTPRYPAEIMRDKSLLALGLFPRINDYFKESLTPTATLTSSQRTILRGIVDFAGNQNLFPRARPAVSAFVVTMLQGKFARESLFDDEVVAGLSGLLKGRLKDQRRADMVSYVDLLAYDIEKGLDASTLGRSGQFGGGSHRAVRRLPDLVSDVLATANGLVRSDSRLAVHLQTNDGKLGKFQERVMRVLAVFLEVADDDRTQSRAVLALRTAVGQAESSAVVGSGVISRLGEYAKATAKRLSPNAKAELANVFAVLAAHSDDVKSAALAALNENVEWLQRQQKPIWFTLLSDDQIRALVALPVLTSAPLPHLEFLEAVIANGGARGNSPEMAAMAVDAYQRYLAAPALAGMQQEMRARLRAAMEKTPYPIVAARIERALAAMGS